MPRRKISIEEAFDVLQQAGINVQVKPSVEEHIQPTPPEVKRERKGQIFQSPVQHPLSKTTKLTLWAKHSIGSGGSTVVNADGKSIENAGVQTYGPGVCYVPNEYVGHLMHQDQAAKAADDRMLDRTQRSYLVVRRANSQGHFVDVGVQVNNDLFSDMGSLSGDYLYKIT